MKREIDQDKFVKDCVITIVADDYENFDLILKWAKRLGNLRGFHVSKAQVVEGLKNAINERYVSAYDLPLRFNPSVPVKLTVDNLRRRAYPAKYSTGRLHQLWFYATAKGKRAAKGIPKLSGGKL